MPPTLWRSTEGASIVQIVVAMAILAIAAVGTTHAMLVMNRNAATARVKNAAKAIVLGRIQEVAALPYDPGASVPVIPAIVAVQNKTETVSIPVAEAGLPNVQGTLRWKVEAPFSDTNIRRITCRLEYQYLGKAQYYEVVTFRSPD